MRFFGFRVCRSERKGAKEKRKANDWKYTTTILLHGTAQIIYDSSFHTLAQSAHCTSSDYSVFIKLAFHWHSPILFCISLLLFLFSPCCALLACHQCYFYMCVVCLFSLLWFRFCSSDSALHIERKTNICFHKTTRANSLDFAKMFSALTGETTR